MLPDWDGVCGGLPVTALSQKETQTGILTVAEQGCFRDASGMLQGLFLHADMEVYTTSLSTRATINSYCAFQLSEMSRKSVSIVPTRFPSSEAPGKMCTHSTKSDRWHLDASKYCTEYFCSITQIWTRLGFNSFQSIVLYLENWPIRH